MSAQVEVGKTVFRSAESFSTDGRETGLICLSGEATVKVDGKEITLVQYDSILRTPKFFR
jgi:hypothetical protein